MEIEFTEHALDRMHKYLVTAQNIKEAIQKPDSVFDTYGDRKLYQKRMSSSHVLRVIIEEKEGIKTVITLYKARRDRYEI